MKYNKPPISISDQIQRLKARGLKINNDNLASSYLSNISYYRLRAYTYPFQDNNDPNHPFKSEIKLEDIISLYVFDRKLRLLLFDALEKIEISLRTQIIYQWAVNHGGHWQLEPKLFRDPVRWSKILTSLESEINRSKETFIEHYKNKYTNPEEPPVWMSLEVSSMSSLSLIFQTLKKGSEKLAVTKHYGLKDISILENWLHCFSNIRNICAHHGRLWNRRFTTHIKLPKNTSHLFVENLTVIPYKLYGPLCCIQYVLNIIAPGNVFKQSIKDLMGNCPLKQEKEMGFPKNWLTENFWK